MILLRIAGTLMALGLGGAVAVLGLDAWGMYCATGDLPALAFALMFSAFFIAMICGLLAIIFEIE